MTEDGDDGDQPSGTDGSADRDGAGDSDVRPADRDRAGGDPPGATAIRRLDQATIERIAAGEVVERPASVVKELVENSLDAGADRIDVEIDGDGTGRIAVSDDGSGMSEADVRAAVREHTTSKIADIDDLESGVHTLGFRGEALHTIGAVSRLTIRTKPRGATGAGTELRYEGGETVAVEPTGCPEGTNVEVEDLFYNTPARRKYLKTEATEFAHVNRIVSRYALANPDVAVSLTHDDRETFATTGQGDLRAAIMSVYGREVAEAMIPTLAGDPDDPVVHAGAVDRAELPEGPLSGLSGFVSHPETTRSSREYVTAFVNGRWVDAGVVREAVVEAYGGQLAADRYPFVVLFLDLPADTVDVNVHPRKMEVRFEEESALRTQVRTAVRRALLDHGLVRSSAPRGQSAPEETSVSPRSPGDGGAASDSAGDPGSADESTPEPRSAGDGRSADGSTGGSGPRGESTSESRSGGDGSATEPREDTGTVDDPDRREAAGSTADPDERRDDAGTVGGAGGSSGTAGERRSGTGERSRERDGARSDHGSRDGDPDGGSTETGADDRADGRKFAAPTEQRTLSGEAAMGAETYDRLPRMRVLGQFDDTYVVAETPDGLVLVDQHAADERIHYERLRAAFEASGTAQALADPVEVELTAGEAASLSATRETLAKLGFQVELSDADDAVDARTVRVTAVPAVFDETLSPADLRDVLASLVEGDRAAETVDALADEFLADLACHPAITGNTSLTEGSVLELLSALDDCENPYACPHGRPVLVQFDRGEIEARFERDYPGHGSRRED